MTAFDNLLDILFPPLCLRCEREGVWVCSVCKKKLPERIKQVEVRPFTNAPQTYSWVAFAEGWAEKLIHRIKFGGCFAYLEPIAKILSTRFRDSKTWGTQSFDAVTFVPLHVNRKRKRGFDQSELLAKNIAKNLSLPLRPLLRRTKQTHTQAELPAERRRQNIAGAFQPNRPVDILPYFRYEERSVLLIDDVVTTGATLAAATTVLKAFGVEHVTALTIAHG